MEGEEPPHSMLDSISYRFESAALANEARDPLRAKRALMLGAFMQPLIWLDLVSVQGLTNIEARRVSQRLEIKQANDSLASTTRQALNEVTELLDGRGPGALEDKEFGIYAGLRGFLQESTVVLLGNRHNTAKMVVLPTLEFEDALQPNRNSRADGVLYDNRRVDTNRRKYTYQVKSNDNPSPRQYSVPVISSGDMGNHKLTAGWRTTYSYTTLKELLHEREGDTLAPAVSSNLDKIWGKVRNKIMLAGKKELTIPTPSQVQHFREQQAS